MQNAPVSAAVRNSQKIKQMCMAALLCAVGILIPMLSPVKIQIPPMSFTLASHVALFLALFISPPVAAAVTVGTTVGFVFAGFPPVVVLRAAVQIVFVVLGAYWLKKSPAIMQKATGVFCFGMALGVVHAVCEALVVTAFYFNGMAFEGGFVYTVLGLVGVGTLVHSMVDFALALLIWKACAKALHLPASYLP